MVTTLTSDGRDIHEPGNTDPDTTAALNAYASVQEQTGQDELCEEHAEAEHIADAAQTARFTTSQQGKGTDKRQGKGAGKGKGKGKPFGKGKMVLSLITYRWMS